MRDKGRQNMIKKKLILDTIFNIIATAIPILVLQLIVLPIIGKELGESQYGLVITLISFSTLISVPIGNVLNNIKLLTYNQYTDKNISGDFNILLLSGSIINVIAIIIGTIYYERTLSVVSVSLMILLSCLTLLREYLIVGYRIELNYKAILINNLILGLGYALGLVIFYLSGYWQFIYIAGTFLSLLYVLKTSNLIKERLVKTQLFGSTLYKSVVLLFSVFIKTFLSYADKLLIFPLLGPAAVATYYSSTLLGKIMSMAITPISSVMLSYLAKMEKIGVKKFVSLLSVTINVGIIGYFIAILISGPVLRALYPDWAERSMELIYITTATAIIQVITSVINPIILRFNNVNWQAIISGINVIIYLILSLMLYKHYGLYGFSVGVMIASLSKLVMMIFVYFYEYKSNQA